jgi:hypothetical protein
MTQEVSHKIEDQRFDELEAAIVHNLQPVECPLTHLFTDKMYIREIVMPTGALVTSKIHKTEHPYVLSKGKMLVRVDDGEWIEIAAPYTGITKAGTRRIAYIIEECVWTTFHVNNDELRDIDAIEDMVIEHYENPLLKETKNIE